MTTISVKPISGREGLYWLMFGTLLCLGITLLGSLVWMLNSGDNYQSNLVVLQMADYPPSDTPYLVEIEDMGLVWLVNTGTEFSALDRRVYDGVTGQGFCVYSWTPANGRFEDPCHGSKFTLDGTYIEGPPRILVAYPLTFRDDGTLVINTNVSVREMMFELSRSRDE